MNIDVAKDNLMRVIVSGRITLNDRALNLQELAELQQNIMFLFKAASPTTVPEQKQDN